MSTKEAYLAKVEAQLRIWNAEVEKLEAKTGKVQDNAKLKYRQQLKMFLTNKEVAQRMVQQLKQAGKENWQELKGDIDSTLQSLKQEFNLVRKAAQKAGIESIGWAQGMADEDIPTSIGWAEGIADEDVVESIGWAEGYDKKKK